MKHLTLLLLLSAISLVGFSQSVFKALPKHKDRISIDTTISGNTWTGFRFAIPVVLYALPNSTIYTGVTFDYEHDTYNTTTQKYYTDWAIGLGAYEGGQIAPANVSAVTAVGLHLALFNKLLIVGVLYNFQNKNAQGAIGGGVSLNN